jgi:hypothetical protein
VEFRAARPAARGRAGPVGGSGAVAQSAIATAFEGCQCVVAFL